MKTRLISLLSAVVITVGTTSMLSCGNSAEKNSAIEESHNHEHAKYQCPMDCEEGKTYDEEGKCPVCGMELKEV